MGATTAFPQPTEVRSEDVASRVLGERTARKPRHFWHERAGRTTSKSIQVFDLGEGNSSVEVNEGHRKCERVYFAAGTLVARAFTQWAFAACTEMLISRHRVVTSSASTKKK